MEESTRQRIQSLLDKHRVLLFMKGNKLMPMCGFSSAVVQVLNKHGVPYETVNILSDPELRQGIKDFTNWPTIPQLYVDGRFIGGCDIVREMDAAGELAPVLQGAQQS